MTDCGIPEFDSGAPGSHTTCIARGVQASSPYWRSSAADIALLVSQDHIHPEHWFLLEALNIYLNILEAEVVRVAAFLKTQGHV